MQPIHLAWVDYAILLAYTAFVIGIGFALRRYLKTSSDYLTSGRSIPAWVTGLAFMAANLGALELVGMAASGAKYGIATAHFYWVGAIPYLAPLAAMPTSSSAPRLAAMKASPVTQAGMERPDKKKSVDVFM